MLRSVVRMLTLAGRATAPRRYFLPRVVGTWTLLTSSCAAAPMYDASQHVCFYRIYIALDSSYL